MFSSLGRLILVKFSILMEILFLLARALRNGWSFFRQGKAAIRLVFYKQVYFTGLEAATIIVSIAVILGAVVMAQVVSLVGANGSLAGKVLVWVVLRELAPLLTAVIVIARSGTAIATEIGSMKISGEIEALEMAGIPTDRYLVLPRVIGVTTSVVILTVYFVLTAFAGSFLVGSVGWHIPFESFIQGILSSLGLKEVIVLFTKSLFFGLFVSSACCFYGLSVDRSATEIPQAATRGVITSLLAVFLVDGLVTYMSSLAAL